MKTRKAGKRIGGCTYIHSSVLPLIKHSDIDDMILEAELLLSRHLNIGETFEYTIIKTNKAKQEVSFIHCKDFNASPEPTVGDSYKVNLLTGKVAFRKGRKNNPQIYHHKWMFVDDSYTGFDVEESKKRSKQWQESGIEYDSRKIGNYDYWNEVILKCLTF
jgi:hypothetical protein